MMKTSPCDRCTEALEAYVDDELLPAERREVEAHLEQCAQCRGEHDALTHLRSTLNEGLVRYQAPDVLKARIRGAITNAPPLPVLSPRKSRSWIKLATAAALIAVTSSALTLGVEHRLPTERGVAEQVLASHVRSLMPGHLVDVVSTDQHNVKPWFNGRVDVAPAVPDLASSDFRLAGGRVDYIGSRPVAVVVYTRRKHVINVYSWPSTGDEPPRAETVNGFHIVHWRRDGLDQWAISDINTAELNEFVRDFLAS